eukprot:6198994-Pleurochrysis_carterae.AAC.3
MPYANAEGAGSEAGSRRAAGTDVEGYQRAGAGRKRPYATALKEADVGASGGRGDGRSGCGSRSKSATAASPPEGPGCERAKEGSNIEWHVETLRVYTKPCEHGVEGLKATTAARISHGVSSAKDMLADMEPRQGFALRKAGIACRYSSARCATSSFVLSFARWKVAESESDASTTRGKWRKES